MPKLYQYDGEKWIEIAKNGVNGKDGQDAIVDEESIVKKVLKKVPKAKDGKDGSPDTGEEIVNKLSKLKGEKRLDKSAIKGLDKMQKEIDHIGAFGSSGQEYRINGTKVSANSQTLNFIAGSNTTITGTPTSDGANITITATGGGGSGTVDSVVAGHGIDVDATDPANPIVAVDESELDHNLLGGLQGGTGGQYNHLTNAQLTVVQNTSGTNTGDQTITLTGAVTGSGTGSFATTLSSGIDATKIADGSVNNTEFQYINSLTSNAQTQITGKVSKTGDTMTGTLTNSQTTTASPVDGFVASTSSTATSGNQKASATVKWTASGWKSSGPTSARQVDFRAWILPEQAVSGEPSSIWKLQSQVNNGGWTDHFWIDSKVGGLGAYFNTNGSNGTPGTTRAITINNVGTSSWIDWTFSGTRKVSDGANSNGDRYFYASGGSYFSYIDGNSNSLFSYSYPTGLYHTGGGWFGGRVNAGQGSNPSSTLASQGSFASKAIRVTGNYTLTVNESVVYADASSAACSGTPTYNCSHWTNQTDCQKWDAHGGCSWFAGYSCSAFNGDQSACESQSGCTYETASCSGFGDESTCNSYSGCSWTNTPQSCSGFDEATCGTTSGCSASYDYCSNYSDAGGDGTACATVSGYGCTYDSGSGTCSGDPGFWYTGCSGSYDNFSCTGDYYTGNCSGMYGASCNGTSTCSGIDDSTNCGFETGCTWSTSITLNLPQITTVPYRHYWVYNDSSSGADVIIQPYSGDQIDKTTSYTLANYKDSIHIQAFYESVSCNSFNEGACTPTGCSKVYSNCSWDGMSSTCSGNAVCDGIGDQSTCESTTYFSYCSGYYYSVKNWYLLSRS